MFKVNGREVLFLIDTGADFSCVNSVTAKEIGIEDRLVPCEIAAHGYTMDRVPLVGETRVDMVYQGKSARACVAVTSRGKNVLGIHECVGLGIVRFDDGGREELNNNIIDVSDYFYFGSIKVNKIFGVKLKNFSFGLNLKPGAIPYMAKERPVPFGIRSEVEAQVNKMVQEGVLVPTEQADWVSPIVVVRKPNGAVRI